MTESDPKVGFILASASPARAEVLRKAGIPPSIVVPNVDEDAILAPMQSSGAPAAQQVQALAWAKAERSVELIQSGQTPIAIDRPTLLVACDSMLEFDGQMEGKPHTAEVATARIRRMRGRDATLWTGHAMFLLSPDLLGSTASNTNRRGEKKTRPLDELPRAEGSASTIVHFGPMTDAEIDAYVRTGEPLNVAGSFTIDGLGGAFLRGVTGDPHSVIGISLPLLREMAASLEVFWPDLWVPRF